MWCHKHRPLNKWSRSHSSCKHSGWYRCGRNDNESVQVGPRTSDSILLQPKDVDQPTLITRKAAHSHQEYAIMLSRGVSLLRDNARPQVAIVVQEALAREKMSSSVTPSLQFQSIPIWLSIVWTLEENSKGEAILLRWKPTAVTKWFNKEPKSLSDRTRRLPKQWNACLNECQWRLLVASSAGSFPNNCFT